MSMGLVAYGSSDESDDDEASLPKINKNTSSILKDNLGEGLSQKCIPAPLKLDNTKNNHFQETLILSTKPSVLPLPSPKSSINDLDIDIKRLKSAGTVKIAIPSLSELQNEELEQPLKKKLKPSQKGSGLFALLPNPKNQGLIPKSVNNKYTKSSTTPKLKSIPLTVEGKPSIFSDNYDSEDENDVTNNKNDLVDFFFFGERRRYKTNFTCA
uniref:Uncharacterized protein n=1 Tax=Clastoptera arizonana TaxID=38151 RepID=A0A1B6CRA7_9HEMI